MSGYLEEYGAGVDQRLKWVKFAIAGVILLAIAALAVYLAIRDRAEQQRIEQFLASLRSQDYKSAYALWGCTEQKPCRDYRLEMFLEDWGPKSGYADGAKLSKARMQSCSQGIMQELSYPGQPKVTLWVERATGAIGFSPYEIHRWSGNETVSEKALNLLRDAFRVCDTRFQAP